jgi:hypothetical protein
LAEPYRTGRSDRQHLQVFTHPQSR